jgi:hypothetical protein
MATLSVEYIPPDDLKPYGRNARTHSRKQIRQIADSIRIFGFTNPILIDSQNMILAGHGRVEAAALLAMAKVPCVRIETMTPEQKRAYVLADNKLAMNAGWDEELLAEELKGLLEIDLDFDIGVTGFSIPEIDSLIDGLAPEEPGNPEEDQLPSIPEGPTAARLGDFWALAPIGSFAAAPWNQRHILPSWQVSTPKWSSPTLPTTCRSQDMPADQVRSSIASSSWPRAK